jgi:protein TonB
MDDLKIKATVRISGSLLLALMINVLLFAMMQQMVAGRRIRLNDITDAQFIDYIRIPDSCENTPQKRLHKKAPEPPKPPKQPPQQAVPQMKAVKQPLPKPLPKLKIDAPLATIDSDGPCLGSISARGPEFIMARDLISVLRESPPYPRLLKRQGIEGNVVVEFTVTEQGLVQDPVIIESRPHEDFGKSVIETVLFWKFQPYRIGDLPVAVRARQGINFTLE